MPESLEGTIDFPPHYFVHLLSLLLNVSIRFQRAMEIVPTMQLHAPSYGGTIECRVGKGTGVLESHIINLQVPCRAAPRIEVCLSGGIEPIATTHTSRVIDS